METHARIGISNVSPDLIDRDVVDVHARANDVHVHLLLEVEFASQDAEACVEHAELVLDGRPCPGNEMDGEQSANTVGRSAWGGAARGL